MHILNHSCVSFVFVCILLGGTIGCKEHKKSERIMPPLAVEALTAGYGERQVSHEFIASVKPLKVVRLVARISGYLEKRHFEGGTFVKGGDLLYSVERNTYDIALQHAEAQLEQCKANAWNAEVECKRIHELFAEKIASTQQFDQATANWKSAKAKVSAAEAELNQAKLNLSYTQIRAPFDGWIGINTTDAGNYLASASQTLAEIAYVNQVKVEFHLSDAYLLGKFRKDIVSGFPPDWIVKLKFRDGTTYPLTGRIKYWENLISPTSATMTIQAEFDNPDRLLIPGLYVTAVLEDPEPEQVLLLDRRALKAEQGSYFAMIITPEKTLEYRPVEIGPIVGDKIVITSGMKAGEEAAMPGNPLLLPGTKVKIVR